MKHEWYCVHTKPRKEAQVADHLHRHLGLEVYYPRLRLTRRIRRVKHVVEEPLFPRYHFCHLKPSVSYRAVRYAPDVVDIVSRGGLPQVVSPEIIAGLRAWAGDALDVITIRPPLRPGDHVEILTGPLRGLSAVVMRDMPETARVAILLEALGCGARMVIDRSDISVTR